MELRSIGLVGGGKMSSEIFKLLSEQDFDVVLWLRRPDAVATTEEELLKKLRRRAKKPGDEGAKAQARLDRLKVTSDMADLATVDLIIESIAERQELKIDIFSRLDAVVQPKAIFATNTSSLSPSSFARHTKRPELFAGLHFFYPVSLMSSVEIVACEKTNPEVLEVLDKLVRTIGKRPIRVLKEVSAFLINRVLAGYYHEGAGIVGEGHWMPSDVDRAGKKFAMMGPCESIDHAGVDVVINGFEMSDESWGEKDHVVKQTRGFQPWPPIYARMRDDGRLGIKSGAGYYRYENRQQIEDPEYFQRVSPTLPDYHIVPKDDEATLTERLWHSLLLEAVLSDARGIGTKEDIDYSIKEILGLERGPFAYIDHVGRDVVRAKLLTLEARFGPRFAPIGILKDA